MALSQALEFAPGTTEHCQKIILGMFEPRRLLQAYRTACREHKTRDIAIVCPGDPDNLIAGPRKEYADGWVRRYGTRTVEFACARTAHAIVKVPADTDAFWLVVHLAQLDAPLTVVLYALPYEQVSADAALIGEAS